MIEVKDLSMTYPTREGPRQVLEGIEFSVARGERLAILGRNGAGKSTLIKVLGGVLRPTTGSVRQSMSLSWPIGFHGGFHYNLTGLDNIRFISRIYDAPFQRLLAFTEDFAELGDMLRMEVGTYSTGMKARLAFALSIAIDFDCYLVDEVIAAGDPQFQRKCSDELLVKRRDRAMIMASHDVGLISRYCDRALVLKQGRAKVFSDVATAIAIYQGL